MKKRDANHWEKGDHSGARLDLCTVYGHIHQQVRPLLFYIRIKRYLIFSDIELILSLVIFTSYSRMVLLLNSISCYNRAVYLL